MCKLYASFNITQQTALVQLFIISTLDGCVLLDMWSASCHFLTVSDTMY